MKYEIEYGETINKCSTLIIEVEDENEGEAIADKLDEMAGRWDSPDDILSALKTMGKTIL